MSSSFSEKKSQKFYNAARDGNLRLVESLSLDPEVNLNWINPGSYSPFMIACFYDHVDIAQYLLRFHDNQRRPIDYNYANDKGRTSFSLACRSGFDEVVEMLLEDQRIDVSRPDNFEETPLYYASYWGHVGIVKMILASTRRQIGILMIDEDGRTVADLTREQGEEILQSSRETEESFQERRNKYFDTASLIEAYEKDPHVVRARLRRELECDERWAGELFALVVFLSDGYLRIPETQGEENSQGSENPKRFFKLASLLPLDLQMVLCNRVFGLGDSIVKKIYSEQGFKKFARD